ncbi:cysteine synthase A [Citrobacter koseri]|uniref:cysteine synthase n=1 Tax=Citrobacter koseri TaxID=545 RepID=A0A2X2VNT3_CITKO|nr:cysteine synthase A [Citrobacter koseri]
MSKIFEDNSLTIGHTPLVRLNRIGNGRILAKVESRNPSFSVKCRIGANMIWDAEKRGVLKPGVELVEPTSGQHRYRAGLCCCRAWLQADADHARHHER